MGTDNEAAQFAKILEKIGRRILICCENLPDDLLQWSPPFSEGSSPMALAIELTKDIEQWVLIPIGGKKTVTLPPADPRPIHSFIALSACYGQCIKDMHTILDPLPDSFMNLFIEPKAVPEKARGKHRPTVRTCLLTAVEHAAYYQGKIELSCKAVSWSAMPMTQKSHNHARNMKMHV
ncbi:hypothetical protein KDA_64780 [Dictyobacter alpinus]|uniref:DinB-like domain-containing protein n=1 Tax=Dictyobacter alpinus TaxID=2014873 RepID=A0A402BHV9_9CHLR|nr:hypothetical protein [Dictyobacter alpinus]GCE30994.1 hypothetical protein KDA_64780 [Dictyobacter alpinus]